MPELYATLLIIASLKNVPWLGWRVAKLNGAAIFAQHPELLVVTETWHPLTKLAIRRAAPASFRWYTAPGQSVMVGWDSTKYRVVWKKRIRGGASPRISRVCDRRDLFVVCLEDIATGRRIVLVGVHAAPVPTIKAPDMVPTARLSHTHAADQIEVIAESTPYPVVTAGDFNVTELVSTNNLRVGPGITHTECFNGRNVAFGPTKPRLFALHSDHPGVTIPLTLDAAA